MIDPKKTYQTRAGQRVINISIVLKNSAGRFVTYPVKGSVVVREKPYQLVYHIWSLSGRSNVVWPDPENDLVEVKS